MLNISLASLLALLLTFVNISSSTFFYASNKDAPDPRYCVLVDLQHSDYFTSVCQNEPPFAEFGPDDGGVYAISLYSGFDSSDQKSTETIPRYGQVYLWTEIYDYVWVGADGCLYHSVSTTNLNIFSAAFMNPCRPNSNGPYPKPNPYYWHGRNDFNHKAEQLKSNIGPGEPGLSSATSNEELTSSLFPLSDPEGPSPEPLAFSPSSDIGNNLDDNSLAFSSDLTPHFSNNDETTGLEGKLFASSNEGAEETLPMSLFSIDDSNTFDGLKDTSLFSSDNEESNLFSKRGRKRARAV